MVKRKQWPSVRIKEDETSRWWFSDEALQEAIATIVDVVPRGTGHHAELPDNEDEESTDE